MKRVSALVLPFVVVPIVSVALLTGCAEKKTASPSVAESVASQTTGSVAADTVAMDGSVAGDSNVVSTEVASVAVGSDGADGSVESVSGPKILAVGESSISQLNRAEVCGLVSTDLLAATYKLNTKPGSPAWSQSEDETLCEVAFIDETDGATPHFDWYVSGKGKENWATEPSEGTKVSPSTVGGREAAVVSRPGPGFETSTLIYVLIDPTYSVWFEANGWDGASDRSAAEKIVSALATTVSTLKPTPQPPVDAKVASALDMTPGQLCSLVREPATAALLANSLPGGIDSFLLQGDAVQCSKGGAKLNVTISSREPFVLDEKLITKRKIDGLDATFEKPPIVDGEGLQYMSLTVPQGPIWVTLQAGLVSDTPEVENVLKSEMSYVLSELKKRIG
jgi:hypothetical protein